jgi:Tol biopolymer transport system component
MNVATICRRMALGLVLGAIVMPRTAATQSYFGQNHVQFDKLKWQVLGTQHFDVHYYPSEKEAAYMVGKMAERSYARLSRIFNHQFRERKPIIVFASRGDFAQNNIFGDLGEGTGGVTDALRQRNMFFLAGDVKESEHVMAHEMVHQFQYDIFSRGRAGANLGTLGAVNPPLWFAEGMAEYLSIGPDHPATDAIMRDAAFNGHIPTIEQMTDRPDLFFPYRYGEAFLEYVAKRWGDDVIGEIMQAVPAGSVERAFQRHTGLSLEELGEEWKEAVQTQYLPQLATRDRARRFSQAVLNERQTGGSNPVYVAPALSPDGRKIVFLSTGSFARAEVFLDLYLADATTGKRLERLTKSTVNAEFEELRVAYSQSAFSPDGKKVLFTAQREGRDILYIRDLARGRSTPIRVGDGIEQMISPSFSPDGRQIVFSGTKGGFSDLYVIDSDGRNLRPLTSDPLGDHMPQWSPDGTKIAFVSERGPETDLDVLRISEWRISILDLESGEISILPNQAGRNLNPMWAPDGQSLAFISDRTGNQNIFLYDFTSKEHYQLTDVVGSVMSFTEMSPAISWARDADRMAFVYYDDGNWTVWGLDNPRMLKKQPFPAAAATVVATNETPTTTDAFTRPPPLAGRGLSTLFDSGGRRMSAYRLGGEIRGASVIPEGARNRPRGGLSIAALLDSAALSLPDAATFTDKKYKATLRAEYVERPQIGYAQDNFGRGVFGGTTIILADMLGNHQLAIAGAINGRIDEAQVYVGFRSLANRFQYSTGFSQQPIFFTQDASLTQTGAGQFIQTYQLSRYIIREGFFNGAYPLNRFSRFELGTSVNSIERATEYLSRVIDQTFDSGFFVDSIADRSTLNYISPYAAYVSDNTLFGLTGPIYGRRMRFEVGPTLGGANWMHYSADYRRYDPIFFNFLTFATRVAADISAGDDEMEFPKYIGRPYFVRGYDREVSSSRSCGTLASNPSACSALQLLGSRVAFANAELRFPLLRSAYFGLLPFAFPPVEGLFFFDVGAAWRGGRQCSPEQYQANSAGCGQKLHLTRPDNYDYTTQRYFLSSHGFGIRVNLFNIAIVRWDYAIPHDAASKKGFWVWTLGSSY